MAGGQHQLISEDQLISTHQIVFWNETPRKVILPNLTVNCLFSSLLSKLQKFIVSCQQFKLFDVLSPKIVCSCLIFRDSSLILDLLVYQFWSVIDRITNRFLDSTNVFFHRKFLMKSDLMGWWVLLIDEFLFWLKNWNIKLNRIEAALGSNRNKTGSTLY